MIAVASNRVLLLAVIMVALLVALGACGRKGSPKPPAGQESAYTYPQAYPAPSTVKPPPGGQDPQESAGFFSIFEGSGSETAAPAVSEEEPESILITPPAPQEPRQFREPPNVLPSSRTKTTTY